jgi:thymidylate synthase (FAD)
MIVVNPEAVLEAVTPNALELIERAGRVCYKSEDRIEPGSAERFIRDVIMKKQHLSVLEHASATFRFVCDRGVTHEMVRHRIASYSQESTRYCNYGKEKHGGQIKVIQPPGLSDEDYGIWEHATRFAETCYLQMLDHGVAPQIARSVLPNCLKTEIVMTANFREWMHVFELRCAPTAHPQIREIMKMAQTEMVQRYPCIFGAQFVEQTMRWGPRVTP